MGAYFFDDGDRSGDIDILISLYIEAGRVESHSTLPAFYLSGFVMVFLKLNDSDPGTAKLDMFVMVG